MSNTNDPRIKQLKIKTGVVKRIVKEQKMYEQEINDQAERIKKMIEENKDEYDIKKAKEILEDSRQMVPDCKTRLTNAVYDLEHIIQDSEFDLAETDEFKDAKNQLEEVM